MSFHAQNQAKLSNWKFIEMWVDPSSDLPYVLMLVGDVDGSYTLYDPTEEYKVVYAARDYEKVKDFLLEDEYVQIRGRYQENAEARKVSNGSRPLASREITTFIVDGLVNGSRPLESRENTEVIQLVYAYEVDNGSLPLASRELIPLRLFVFFPMRRQWITSPSE